MLVNEIKSRLHAMFQQLADGNDVPPSQRLRTEGMMEAAVLVEEAESATLQELMEVEYRAVFARSFDAEFGSQWRDAFPFPQIPGFARRAPVIPSTDE